MTSITLSDIIHANTTPATPKFVRANSFNPVHDTDAYTFLRNYERSALLNGWGDREKLLYFEAFLEGSAEIWFKNYKLDQSNQNKNWKDVADDFKTEYVNKDLLKDLRRKLKDRKQGDNEDILTYYYDLLDLAYRVDPNTSLAEIQELFEAGLHPNCCETEFLVSYLNLPFKQRIFKMHNAEQHKKVTNPATPLLLTGTHSSTETSTSIKKAASNLSGITNHGVQNSVLFRTKTGKPVCFRCHKANHTRRACKTKLNNKREKSKTR